MNRTRNIWIVSRERWFVFFLIYVSWLLLSMDLLVASSLFAYLNCICLCDPSFKTFAFILPYRECAPPIDDLDLACGKHDYCLTCPEIGLFHQCECEKDIVDRLENVNCDGWHCEIYRRAAISLFGSLPCMCLNEGTDKNSRTLKPSFRKCSSAWFVKHCFYSNTYNVK